MNWSANDVIDFLSQHDFVEIHTRGSHFYFQGNVDGHVRVVEVPVHVGDVIKPKTLNLSIIEKSGIPREIWIEWAKAGNKKAQKKIRYIGAKH